MTFQHGRTTEVYLDKYDLSAYTKSADVTAEADLPDTTCFGATGRRRQVVGLKDCSIAMQCLHDSTATASYGVAKALYATSTASPFALYPQTGAVGGPAILAQIREKSAKETSPVDGVVATAVELTGDGGPDYGVILRPLTTSSDTGNGTGVDNGAGTTNGGVAQWHCPTVPGSGLVTVDVKVQHSTDDNIYADLVAFTSAGAATTSERKEVAAGATVNQYLREVHTFSGAKAGYYWTVAFARR